MPGEFQAIGESSFDQVLTRRLVGPGGALSPSVAPELFPVIVVENDRPEWQYLYGGRRVAAPFDVAAGGAGFFSTLRLHNPPGSNCLAVIEWIDFVVTTTTTWDIWRSLDSASLATLIATASLDTRVFQDPVAGGGGAQVIASSAASNVALLNPLQVYHKVAVVANTPTLITYPIILAPGTTLNLREASGNIRMGGTVIWRERYLNPTEK